jgi:hypothetical protein
LVTKAKTMEFEAITLRSGQEDFERQVPRRSVNLSRMLSAAIDTDQHAPLVTLDLSGRVLGWVAEYMHRHEDGEPPVVDFPLRSKRMADMCADPWDACFIDKVCPLDVALAAHYLDMEVLLHLCCAKLATKFWYPNTVFKSACPRHRSESE